MDGKPAVKKDLRTIRCPGCRTRLISDKHSDNTEEYEYRYVCVKCSLDITIIDVGNLLFEEMDTLPIVYKT